jgi:hypothetical protein
MVLTAKERRRVAPYAPVRNVLEVLQNLRDRGLQVPVTIDRLQNLGVPEGNAPRTLQALKFLGIVADDGQLEASAELLHRATTEEYPHLLEEIVRKAYAPVWEVTDPATATEVKIADAFRQYDPAAQRPRMVTLFLGLCVEAGIVQRAQRQAASAQPKREPRTPRREPAVARRLASAQYTPVRFVPTEGSERPSALFSITEDDLALLDADQRKRLWDALGDLMIARVAARQKRPDPFDSAFMATMFGQKPGEEPPPKGEE